MNGRADRRDVLLLRSLFFFFFAAAVNILRKSDSWSLLSDSASKEPELYKMLMKASRECFQSQVFNMSITLDA